MMASSTSGVSAPPSVRGLARARLDGRVVLVRIAQGQATVLATESGHPAADVLREALGTGAWRADGDAGGATVPVGDLELLAPVANPSKILCVGLNYLDHADESGVQAPAKPLLFAKFPNALRADGAVVEVPKDISGELDYEGELAVVIGRRASHVGRDEALDHVLGYVAANDLSARDAQFSDGQWLRGKSADGFCPVGPVVVPAEDVADPQALRIVTRLNDQVVQDGSTAEMIFSVAEIISYASHYMTLEPGDLILTGTPPGVGFARKPPLLVQNGDVVTVTVEGIGSVANRVLVV
ncbi:2-keto-4-pentenoate hydratase [Sphaerisporangium krabiense]|uniref:2-keto-4-pentenoate hydratase/2-oxohepta-3-ene-1,7-dioic acid hydratase in catechol pathway n=1 Tax=Sphaerisporangium krabiense TaxID=763782 RepID=A0A7W8Z3F8_9ACTN|nr:fumarylacetoacetate hydrolase family protein [Sphaerisporangium krabiense]MBB5626704.1 2-keto-4-pentenoate hydratase/2-oxohepta-3-ene-1,7-dioic acid hydratase in catechol pathway [Sphaerisporangium krabiense]GII63623.1 2-keto-4-pentenoate hydratase [Sphaerisporangium krabiense]